MMAQKILIAWGLGAFAAFPVVLELYSVMRAQEEDQEPNWYLFAIAVLGAALWPLAWLLLFAWTLRRERP